MPAFERVRNGLRELGADGRVSQIEWSDDGAAMTFPPAGEAAVGINLTDFSIDGRSSNRRSPRPRTTAAAGRGGAGHEPAHWAAAEQSTVGAFAGRPVDRALSRLQRGPGERHATAGRRCETPNSRRRQAANGEAVAPVPTTRKTHAPEIIPVTTGGSAVLPLRNRLLGVRRRVVPGLGHVVVSRQPHAGVLRNR